MGFVLTEEEESIQKTARGVCDARGGTSLLRRLRDERDERGYGRELWAELGSLGLCGLAVPEAHGGAGLGLREVGLVVEELGRSLSPVPFASSALAARLVHASGHTALAAELLPGLADGSQIATLAHAEGVRHADTPSAVTLASAGDGFVLTGEKTFVPDGHVADWLVVSAATSTGVALVVVKKGEASTRRLSTIDTHNTARIAFDGLAIGRERVLSLDGAALLTRALDEGASLLAAEMLGGASEAFARTITYLKERKQFGVPIGSFQALKHRAALMFCELELSRSIVREALSVADGAPGRLSELASVAKARLSDTYVHVANEATQMHGGVGVTDELDIGFFVKRARVCEMMFGDAAFHKDRYARLLGY